MTHITTNSAVADAEIEITPEMIEAGVQFYGRAGRSRTPWLMLIGKLFAGFFRQCFNCALKSNESVEYRLKIIAKRVNFFDAKRAMLP